MHKTTINHRTPKGWHKVSVTVNSNLAEIAASFLATLSDNGVEQIAITDAAKNTSLETIVTYLPDDNEHAARMAQIDTFFAGISLKLSANNQVTIETELIEEEDWNSNWKKHFKPFKLTDRLLIKPSWEDYQCQADELVLEMDPGMAFGTGLHASTSLALLLIEQIFTMEDPPVTVLDVGTGTGILGMSCVLYGAQEVVGIDNDIDARVAATDNIKNNNLDDKMTIDDHELNQINSQFDLVIANITQDVLTCLSEDLCQRVRLGANLVLSGILDGTQAENITKTFTGLGFSLEQSKKQGEWAAFHFTSSPA